MSEVDRVMELHTCLGDNVDKLSNAKFKMENTEIRSNVEDSIQEIYTDFEEPVKELKARFSTSGEELTASFEFGDSTRDYNKLINKPSLNGTELVGNYDEIDPTVPGWAKTPSKPAYNSNEVGAVDKRSFITKSEIDIMLLEIFGR